MASLQHIYRRAHIFWWRRVLRLFDGRIFDIRISLETADRQRARDIGAALTAVTGDVKMMLEEQVTRRADERPTEAELKAIAKAEFENQRARYCDQQREHPKHRAMHTASNTAYADYFQRMIDTGGRPFLEPADEAALSANGYSSERIARLKVVTEHHGEQPQIQPNTAIFYLRQLGFEPSRPLVKTVGRALWPAYRDAAIAAQVQLDEMLGKQQDPAGSDECDAAPVSAPIRPAPEPQKEAEPDDELNPRFGELCRRASEDREIEGVWSSKTARQRRVLGVLFELLVGPKRVADITQADLSIFKAKRRLITEKLSPSSEKERERILELTSRELTPKELKELDAPHAKTINRDLSGLSAVLKWGAANGMNVPHLNVSSLRTAMPARTRARDDRMPTSLPDRKRLFDLPIYTGCLPHQGGRGARVLKCRFAVGTAIVHDPFYWVPLLINYTGGRREEICKFAPEDFHFDTDVPFVRIDFTKSGRIKNAQSKRNLPLHPELLRLGIKEFVEEAI